MLLPLQYDTTQVKVLFSNIAPVDTLRDCLQVLIGTTIVAESDVQPGILFSYHSSSTSTNYQLVVSRYFCPGGCKLARGHTSTLHFKLGSVRLEQVDFWGIQMAESRGRVLYYLLRLVLVSSHTTNYSNKNDHVPTSGFQGRLERSMWNSHIQCTPSNQQLVVVAHLDHSRCGLFARMQKV